MIVELIFQVWIPIKSQEVANPDIECAIFLRRLEKTYYIYLLFCSNMKSFFSNIDETDKWWCKLDSKIECNYMCTSYYM